MNARPQLIPWVTAAVLLFVAIGQHPYGYYTFLRWVVCVAALVAVWAAWHSTVQWLAWVFVGPAILFNPLAPVYLSRSTWRPIDIASALLFLGASVVGLKSNASSS